MIFQKTAIAVSSVHQTIQISSLLSIQVVFKVTRAANMASKYYKADVK